MGTQIHDQNPSISPQSSKTRKIFTICNYILIGAASSCIFLTLSLRLLPSFVGLLLILLHATTIAGAVSGSAASPGGVWYAFHVVATVVSAIFQGSISVLIFTTTGNFLGAIESYVREEDGVVILRLGGGLCVLMFCLELVVMSLAFVVRNHGFVDGCGNVNGVNEEELKNWPWQLKV